MGINQRIFGSESELTAKVGSMVFLSSYDVVKRTIDIIVASTALIIFAPLALLFSLAIKMESSGPVFFSQTRVGRFGKTFRCWKFRSMYADAESRKSELIGRNEMEGGVIFKMRDDPRVTKVGRVLRALSIDELPQLWNVLQGDMSLVGPRPPTSDEVMQYSDYEMRRLDVVPGLTCIWQVSGRSEIPFPEQVRMDLAYISDRSVLLDFKLLLLTIPAVVSGRGAY